jgi:hypothetical protein
MCSKTSRCIIFLFFFSSIDAFTIISRIPLAGRENGTLANHFDITRQLLSEDLSNYQSSLLLLDYQSSLLLLDYQILLHWFFEISYPIPAAPYGLRFDASYPERFLISFNLLSKSFKFQINYLLNIFGTSIPRDSIPAPGTSQNLWHQKEEKGRAPWDQERLFLYLFKVLTQGIISGIEYGSRSIFY